MTTAARAPRSRPETLVKRREIVAAAAEVFGSKGSVHGTLADIAERVGMTHAGILHHFGSKEQLMLEVLSFRDESDLAELSGTHVRPTGIAYFRHLIRMSFHNAQRAGLVQLYAVLSAESVTEGHAARGYFEQRFRDLRDEGIAAFRELCAERGIAEPDTVERAATSIYAIMDGLQVQWLLDPERVDLGETGSFAIEAIVAAVIDPRPALL